MDQPVRETLRAYVLEHFLPGESANSLEDSTRLISSGIIASIALVEFVGFIEDTFGVAIPEQDIGAARMDTIDQLAALVASKRVDA
ncbi:MAG: acyl carrier protein [Proteobacteria bacterium]|nr:MAG: acyl carrier protein [Pseudomonadota bacterium]